MVVLHIRLLEAGFYFLLWLLKGLPKIDFRLPKKSNINLGGEK